MTKSSLLHSGRSSEQQYPKFLETANVGISSGDQPDFSIQRSTIETSKNKCIFEKEINKRDL